MADNTRFTEAYTDLFCSLLDPLSADEIEVVSQACKLIEKHPELSVEILRTYTREIRSNASIEQAIFAVCCEWDITP